MASSHGSIPLLGQIVPWHRTALPGPATVGLIVLVVCIPVIAAATLALFAVGTRRVFRRRRGARSRIRMAAAVESGARAMMSELCPHGWRAQITLFGADDDLPPDAPAHGEARVALDWAELDDERGHVAVERRVWAPSIAEALEAMVLDRRTDATLEQIERGASTWPE